MSERPWQTHDRLCSRRRPDVAYPRSACTECKGLVTARAETKRDAVAAVEALYEKWGWRNLEMVSSQAEQIISAIKGMQ